MHITDIYPLFQLINFYKSMEGHSLSAEVIVWGVEHMQLIGLETITLSGIFFVYQLAEIFYSKYLEFKWLEQIFVDFIVIL